MIARSKPNVDYNFLWECICGKVQQIDNTISNSFFLIVELLPCFSF